MNRHLCFLLLSFLILVGLPEPSFSQPQGDEELGSQMLNVYGGAFLPFGIYGVRDNYALAGVRYAFPHWGNNSELGIWGFNSEGVSMGNLSYTYWGDFVLDTLLDVYLGGGGSIYLYNRRPLYTGEDVPWEQNIGVHATTGVFVKTSETIKLRASFTYTIGFGHNLVVDLGLLFAFPNSEDDEEE